MKKAGRVIQPTTYRHEYYPSQSSGGASAERESYGWIIDWYHSDEPLDFWKKKQAYNTGRKLKGRKKYQRDKADAKSNTV